MLPFAPHISDGIGRRKALSIGCFIVVGGVVLQVLAANVGHFIASRCIIGVGICMIVNAAPVLITELSYPTQRGALTALFNTVWYFGSIFSAWVCYATLRTLTGSIWEWRVPSMLQAVFAMILGTFVLFIPESPRWLVAKGRDQEAIAVLKNYHAEGRERDPLVYFTYGQIREALAIEREINQTTTYLTLFKTPGNLRRMRIVFALGFFSQWSGNGLVSYYLDQVLENVGVAVASTRSLINGGIQIWCLFVAVTAALLVDKVGRRPLFLMSNAGMVVVFICWTITTALWTTQENRPAANASIAMIPIYFLTYSIAYTPMLISYTVEILPYCIRARGFAAMNLTMGIGITTNQFVNPVALKALKWKLVSGLIDGNDPRLRYCISVHRVLFLAVFRVCLHCFVPGRDQGQDARGDGGLVRWYRGCAEYPQRRERSCPPESTSSSGVCKANQARRGGTRAVAQGLETVCGTDNRFRGEYGGWVWFEGYDKQSG